VHLLSSQSSDQLSMAHEQIEDHHPVTFGSAYGSQDDGAFFKIPACLRMGGEWGDLVKDTIRGKAVVCFLAVGKVDNWAVCCF
jgi:hypothetical protein